MRAREPGRTLEGGASASSARAREASAPGSRRKRQGYDDFVIIEKSAGVGGTWYNTRYPGLTCDVKSYIYDFTFEPNPHWSGHYAGQPEILAYMDRVATRYGLRPHLKLDTKVTAAHWSDAAR